MNLVGKYGENSVNLEGTSDALRELSEMLQLARVVEEILLFVPPKPAVPYVRYLRSLTLGRSEDNVSVSRIGEQGTIRGAAKKLGILARNIERLADQPQPSGATNQASHMHVEYHPGHFYLAPGSVPLVITRI
jgi:hypothetical protein